MVPKRYVKILKSKFVSGNKLRFYEPFLRFTPTVWPNRGKTKVGKRVGSNLVHGSKRSKDHIFEGWDNTSEHRQNQSLQRSRYGCEPWLCSTPCSSRWPGLSCNGSNGNISAPWSDRPSVFSTTQKLACSVGVFTAKNHIKSWKKHLVRLMDGSVSVQRATYVALRSESTESSVPKTAKKVKPGQAFLRGILETWTTSYVSIRMLRVGWRYAEEWMNKPQKK